MATVTDLYYINNIVITCVVGALCAGALAKGGWVEIYMECVYSYISLHEEGGGG